MTNDELFEEYRARRERLRRGFPITVATDFDVLAAYIEDLHQRICALEAAAKEAAK